MKKTFKFNGSERSWIESAIDDAIEFPYKNSIELMIDRIEQIISERITPEPGESGHSAEDKLIQKVFYSALKHTSDLPINNMKLFKELSFEMMTTYASQVCADKEADLQDMTALRESAMRTVKNLADRIEPLQNEIDRLNESLTVMLRRNAELEAQIDQFTNPLRIG